MENHNTCIWHMRLGLHHTLIFSFICFCCIKSIDTYFDPWILIITHLLQWHSTEERYNLAVRILTAKENLQLLTLYNESSKKEITQSKEKASKSSSDDAVLSPTRKNINEQKLRRA